MVVDMPQVGAATLALMLAALLYMIYRDLRMLVQMVVDLKEEVMISRMASGLGKEGFDEDNASNSRASSDNGQCEGEISEDTGTREHGDKKLDKKLERKVNGELDTGRNEESRAVNVLMLDVDAGVEAADESDTKA